MSPVAILLHGKGLLKSMSHNTKQSQVIRTDHEWIILTSSRWFLWGIGIWFFNCSLDDYIHHSKSLNYWKLRFCYSGKWSSLAVLRMLNEYRFAILADEALLQQETSGNRKDEHLRLRFLRTGRKSVSVNKGQKTPAKGMNRISGDSRGQRSRLPAKYEMVGVTTLFRNLIFLTGT